MRNSFGNKTRHVFNFTCTQMLRKKGYLVSTIIIGLLIFAGIMVVVLVGANKDKESEAPTKVGKLIVCNHSDIECSEEGEAGGPVLSLASLAAAVEDVLDVKSVTVEWKEQASVTELCKQVEDTAQDGDTDTFFAVVRKTDDGYGVYLVRPKNCTFSEGEVTDAGNAIVPELQKYVERNIDPTLAQFIKMQTVGTTIVIGEDTGLAATFIKFLLPMISGMLMYFMVIIYGQDVARNVAAEKTSKLMETMLSFVTPKALIFGKILAGFVMSVVQVLIWVACGVGGYLVGSVIAKSINPDYTDYVSKAFSAIRAVTGQSAMTLVPVILALAVFFLGLLLYYAIAGIGGSMVTKPEEVASASAVLTFPVLIFWLVGYFAALNQNESMLTVCRYIPFAAPFTVTAEILTGKVSVWVGLIVVAEMFAVTLLLVWIAGKIYRGLVLYNGEKLSIRKMIGVVRGK